MWRVRSGLDPPSISYLNHGRAHKSPRYCISLDSSESNKTPFAIVPHHCMRERSRYISNTPRLHSTFLPRLAFVLSYDTKCVFWCQVSLRQLTFVAFNDHHSITLTGKCIYFRIITLKDLREKIKQSFILSNLFRISIYFFLYNYFNIIFILYLLISYHTIFLYSK